MVIKPRVALITGITGQDGAYLAEFLLKKNYIVHGIKRRASSFNTQRIDHIYTDSHNPEAKFFLHYGDLTDSTNIIRIIQETQPDEIYNLGAQSHVQVSFESPEYTANCDAIGTLRILEAIKILNLIHKTKFYQASTSELYGKVQQIPQNENTPFYPRSPYATSKLYAYWTTVNYRESYGMFATNGILFNHESPIRGETFVTRKITRSAARIAKGIEECLYIGNLEAKRDWGHARDYVEGMWSIMQYKTPEDFVLATNKTTSVRDFLILAFKFAGIELEFEGKGINETARCTNTGKVIVRIDPKYFRPAEVDLLIGDFSKANEKLNWKPKVNVLELCKELSINNNHYQKTEALIHNEGGFLNWHQKTIL